MKMTRAEHLDWCKKRALEYLDKGDRLAAFTSMVSDLGKHEETANHPDISLGTSLILSGNLATDDETRKFIEGFN